MAAPSIVDVCLKVFNIRLLLFCTVLITSIESVRSNESVINNNSFHNGKSSFYAFDVVDASGETVQLDNYRGMVRSYKNTLTGASYTLVLNCIITRFVAVHEKKIHSNEYVI